MNLVADFWSFVVFAVIVLIVVYALVLARKLWIKDGHVQFTIDDIEKLLGQFLDVCNKDAGNPIHADQMYLWGARDFVNFLSQQKEKQPKPCDV